MPSGRWNGAEKRRRTGTTPAIWLAFVTWCVGDAIGSPGGWSAPASAALEATGVSACGLVRAFAFALHAVSFDAPSSELAAHLLPRCAPSPGLGFSLALLLSSTPNNTRKHQR
eukprot:661713-Pleurochrysis_carterae.AAC.2